MTEFYLSLFIIASISLIGWGLIYLERAYQYPFFMGSIFVSFIIPQAFVLYNNPEPATPEALQRVFLMAFLCACMCWFGYQFSPDTKWLNKLNIEVNHKKLYQGGIFLLVIGMLAKYSIGYIDIERGGYSNGWTGTATILWFFSRLLYIALAIFLMEFLKQSNVKNFIFTSLAAYFPLMDIIYAGRRQPTMTFLLIIGLSFWFIRRSIPPRWFFVASVIAIIFLIPLFGANRQIVNDAINQNWEAIESSSKRATEILQENNYLELKNAAILIDASAKTGRYGYGTGYWDAIVFQFFPGQWFGHELKNALQLKWSLGHFKNFFGYFMVPGSTNTGIGDAFAEFDYFGCLVFAAIGYLYKNLWVSANYHKSTFSRLLYIGLASPAMVTITHGTQRFVQEALFQLIFIGLIVYFAREKKIYKLPNSLIVR
ncbi:MAG: hypothetical protein AB4368_27365 [Xenococcaceae cyanobacterium]